MRSTTQRPSGVCGRWRCRSLGLPTLPFRGTGVKAAGARSRRSARRIGPTTTGHAEDGIAYLDGIADVLEFQRFRTEPCLKAAINVTSMEPQADLPTENMNVLQRRRLNPGARTARSMENASKRAPGTLPTLGSPVVSVGRACPRSAKSPRTSARPRPIAAPAASGRDR